MKDLLDKHASICRKVITLRPNSPWYTPDLVWRYKMESRASVAIDTVVCASLALACTISQNESSSFAS